LGSVGSALEARLVLETHSVKGGRLLAFLHPGTPVRGAAAGRTAGIGPAAAGDANPGLLVLLQPGGSSFRVVVGGGAAAAAAGGGSSPVQEIYHPGNRALFSADAPSRSQTQSGLRPRS